MDATNVVGMTQVEADAAWALKMAARWEAAGGDAALRRLMAAKSEAVEAELAPLEATSAYLEHDGYCDCSESETPDAETGVSDAEWLAHDKMLGEMFDPASVQPEDGTLYIPF